MQYYLLCCVICVKKMSLKPFCFEPTVEDIDNRIYEALRVNPI